MPQIAPDSSEEQSLMARCRNGDASSYEQLYRRYAQPALKVARLIVGDWALAEDCLQEATIRAWYAMGRFESGRPFYPWFLKFTVNEALKARERKRWRFAQVPLSLPAADGKSDQERVGLHDAIIGAMARLNVMHRAVLVLFYYSDMSEREVADVLAVPVSTVKSRLHTARQRLAAILKRGGFDHGA